MKAMAKAVNNKHFIDERAEELRRFGALLDKHVTSGLSNIIYKAINNMKAANFPVDKWGYEIEGLTLPIETQSLKHIRPEGFDNAELILDIKILSEIKEWENLNDPFCQLNFSVKIKGSNPVTNKIHYLGFHIDRHDPAVQTNEIHPVYHIQYLQNPKVKEKNDFDHGESMQLDTPRMMHIPMELILGTGLLLSNFAPNSYNKLLADRDYIKLCKEYQERVWKPYSHSLSNHWQFVQNQIQWNSQLLCPYLL